MILTVLIGGGAIYVFAAAGARVDQYIATILLVCEGAFVIGAIVFAILYYIRLRRHDAKIVHGLTCSPEAPDAGMVLEALSSVKGARAAASILDLMCSSNLAKSPGVVQVLSDLGAIIEFRRVDRKEVVEGLGPEVAEWLDGCGDKMPNALMNVKDTTLDKIARVVEETEFGHSTV